MQPAHGALSSGSGILPLPAHTRQTASSLALRLHSGQFLSSFGNRAQVAQVVLPAPLQVGHSSSFHSAHFSWPSSPFSVARSMRSGIR